MAILNTVSLTVPQAINAGLLTMQLGYSAYFHGAPGIGKSQMLEDYAKAYGWGFHAEFLAQKSAGEVRGLPFLDQTQQGKVTRWTIPDFMAAAQANPSRPFILLLDELSAAPPDVQVAAYQILQNRRLGEHVLPDNVLLCGAGNRPDDGAIAYEMGTALADRLCHFHVVADVDAWLSWAEEAQLHPDVIAFVRARPRYLNSEYFESDYGGSKPVAADDDNLVVPTPRSWHRVSNALYAYPNERDTILNALIPGWLGLMTAHSFQTFLHRMDATHSIDEYFRYANDKQRLAEMCPTSQDVLYGVIYNLVYAANTVEHAAVATEIVNFLCQLSTKNYGNEIRAVGFDLLATKVIRQSWLAAFTKTTAYKIVEPYVQKSIQLRNQL